MLNTTIKRINLNQLRSLFSNKYAFSTKYIDLKYGQHAPDLNLECFYNNISTQL